MAITWSKYGLGMVQNLNTQGKFPVNLVDSVSIFLEFYLAGKKSKAKHGPNLVQTLPQHGPNMVLVWLCKREIVWTYPLYQVDLVLKMSELYLLWM